MIVSPLRGSGIVRVVRIVIIWAELGVRCIKSFHTQRSAQVLVRKPQRTKSVHWIKQLWCHDHRDGEVWPELVIGPFPTGARSKDILVNSSAVNDVCGDLVLGILGRIWNKLFVRLPLKGAHEDERYPMERRNASQMIYGSILPILCMSQGVALR